VGPGGVRVPPEGAGGWGAEGGGVRWGVGLGGNELRGGGEMVNKNRKHFLAAGRLHTLLLPHGARARERNRERAGTHLTHSTTLTTTDHSLCTHFLAHSFLLHPAFQIQL